MSRIPKEQIDQIRMKSDIVETIASYIPLNRKGKNFMGLCPFHEDNNPSMSVNPDKQIFKCFVCGEGGNVFSFIQKYEKVHFVDAVIKQAKNINIDISQYEKTTIAPINKRKEHLYNLMKEVRNFTSYQLKSKDGQMGLRNLRERGYQDAVLEKFQVGLALSGNQIFEFLKAKGYSEEEMLSVDVIRVGDTQIQDVFYNRIMFPIQDQFGNVIAFSARTLDPNSTVKYINTGETELYTKSHHIYNLNRVKEKFRYADRIIITEGVTDVFAFSMAGFDEAVSLLGVAISKTQIDLIRKHTKSVMLAFDGDKAGYDATYEIGKRLNAANIPIKIWYNDSGLDPDDLYKKEGAKALARGVEAALGWLDFLLTYATGLYGTHSFEDKKRLVSFFLPNIEHEDALTQEYYLKKLSDLTEFDVSTLKSQVKPSSVPIYETRKQTPQIHFNQISRAELELLNQMILSKEAAMIYASELGYMPHEITQEAALLIQNIYRTHDKLSLADLLSEEISEVLTRFILELDDRLMINTYQKQIVYENIEKIKNHMAKENKRHMLNKLNQTKDLSEKTKLLDALLKKQQHRR